MPSNEDYPHVGDVVPTVASNPSHQFGTASPYRNARPWPIINPYPAGGGGWQGKPIGGEVRVTDPNTGGEKGSKPERYDLVPWEAMDEVARVYEFGSRKYDDHNWRKGYKWSLSIAAAFRHLAKFVTGETYDTESGLHHCAHAAFHMLALVTFTQKGLGTDDRPKSDPAP